MAALLVEMFHTLEKARGQFRPGNALVAPGKRAQQRAVLRSFEGIGYHEIGA